MRRIDRIRLLGGAAGHEPQGPRDLQQVAGHLPGRSADDVGQTGMSVGLEDAADLGVGRIGVDEHHPAPAVGDDRGQIDREHWPRTPSLAVPTTSSERTGSPASSKASLAATIR